VRIEFEFGPDRSPWGERQPNFEHLAAEGPGRFLLTWRDASGEQLRVQLTPASFRLETED
jgi:hypothetical protein